MLDGWALWLLLAGLAVGAAGATLLLLRLPREDDDVGAAERLAEAAWISDTIERHGGTAPESLTEEVLELHRAYLSMPRPPAPSGATAPPLPPLSPAGTHPAMPTAAPYPMPAGAPLPPPMAPPLPPPPPGYGAPPGSPRPPGPPPASPPANG